MKKKLPDPVRTLFRLPRQLRFLRREFPRYLCRLSRLPDKKTLLRDNSLLFLSGSGDYSGAALAPSQQEFLQGLAGNNRQPVWSNFPYHPDFPHEKYRKPGLIFASLSNMLYFWHTLFNPRFRQQLRRHLSPLARLSGCVVIAQSSGLNVLLAGLEHVELSHPLTVFSVGTIARGSTKKKNLTVYHIKGTRDPYCHLLDFRPVHFFPPCDHFGYIRSPEVLAYVRSILKKAGKTSAYAEK